MAQLVEPVKAAAVREEKRLKMSYEEFLAWSGEDTHAEWVDGEVIVFMPPKIIHQQIVNFINLLLSLFVTRHKLGLVLPAPTEMRVRPDGPAREPDLLFVSAEHTDRLTEDRLAGPADLVVEVISDSSVSRDRAEKFYEYQETGIREYWIIDPRPGKERTDFYHLAPDGRYQAALPDEDGRYHAAVVPGFWFRPDWLRQDPLPDPLQALQTIAPDAFQAATK